MNEGDRKAWESLVRAHELRIGRRFTPEELKRGRKAFLERRKRLSSFSG